MDISAHGPLGGITATFTPQQSGASVPAADPARVADGIANVISRLGTAADRNTQSHYWTQPLSQHQIEEAYRSSWLTRKVHDIVPFEMTRAGRNWNADKEQITALEKAERQLKLWPKLRQALRTARLHGGAAIVLGVRGAGMPDQPLRLDRVRRGSLQYAVVLSKHQLGAPMGFDLDPVSPYFMQPLMYEMRAPRGNPVRIHPSRVITFHGQPLPEGAVALSQIDQFWGDPLLYSLKSAIDNAETTQAAVATLLHEIKQDVIKIPNLTQSVATEAGEQQLTARLLALETFRSMFNALLLDGGNKEGKGGEDWETRQISFAQHPELLRQFIAIVGGASDIPVTRIMGESPGGLQSTGKGEQDDFNRSIGARQDADLVPALEQIDEILIRSTLGNRPDEIGSEMAPLDEIDSNTASEIEKREAETTQIYQSMGVLPRGVLEQVAQNRMVETGRWPGLDKALEDAAAAAELEPGPDDETDDLPPAANENDVIEAERRGTITADDAARLLTDASPRPLYVRRDLLNADELREWAEAQGIGNLVPEGEMHVTVLFSREAVDWMKATTDWNEDENGQLTVPAGGARIVEPLGPNGAVVLLFNSSRLAWRHEQLISETGGKDRFPDFQPHVTLSYEADEGMLERLRAGEAIEPYRGALRFGPERFENVVENWRPS